MLTNAAEEQVKRLKYRQKPQKSGLGEITFVQQRGKVPIRKRVREAMELQSDFQWEVAADLKSCKKPFPIPAATRPCDLEHGRERSAPGGVDSAS